MKFLASGFFMSHLPPSPENNIRVICTFSKIPGDIRKSRCTTVSTTLVAYLPLVSTTSGNFATGINPDTDVKFCHPYRWCR
jgi:hypothetical protein